MKWIQTIKGWALDAVLLFILSFFLYALILAPTGMPLYFQVLKLKKAQEESLESTRQEQKLIQSNKQLLENDEEYFDREARIVWGYVKPNETLYWYSKMEDDNGMDEHE